MRDGSGSGASSAFARSRGGPSRRAAREEDGRWTVGYEFELPPEPRWVEEGGKLLASERDCCPFFRLELISPERSGPVLLRFRSEEAVRHGLGAESAKIFS